MAIKRLNHAVLYVRNAERSLGFYQKALGFEKVGGFPGAVFMKLAGSSNDHDLALFAVGDDAAASNAGRGGVGLYHLAWEVETLRELQQIAERLSAMGALVGASDHVTTKALYAHDPDGLEFEVSWLVPVELVTSDLENEAKTTPTRALDIDKEIDRYGADTAGLKSVVYEGTPATRR